jgi:hypothetical protein
VAAQQRLHLTRAFGAPLYRGFLHSLVGLFRMVVLQIRRGQVSQIVGRTDRVELSLVDGDRAMGAEQNETG